jgi:hypothetical protein
LIKLVGTARRPNQVVGLIEDLGLPLVAQEPFVAQDVAEREVVDNRLGRFPLIGVGGNQFISLGMLDKVLIVASL